MNRIHHLYCFLLIAIVSFATILFKNDNSKEKLDKHIIEHFQKTFKQKEDIAKLALNNSFKKNINLYKEGITVISYINDSLAYWSDNTINIDNNTKSILEKEIYAKIGSGYFYIAKKQKQDTSIYALILIQSKHIHSNNYLHNSIQEEFTHCNNIQISDDTSKDKYAIYDSSNKQIFSLDTSNCSIKDSTSTNIIYHLLFLFIIAYIIISFYKGGKSTLSIFAYLSAIILIRILIVQFNIPQLIFSKEISEIVLLNNEYKYLLSTFYFDSILTTIAIYISSSILKNTYNKLTQILVYFIQLAIITVLIYYLFLGIKAIIDSGSFSLSLQKWEDINIMSYLIFLWIFSIIYTIINCLKQNTSITLHQLNIKIIFSLILITSTISIYLLVHSLLIYSTILSLIIFFYAVISSKIKTSTINQPFFYLLLVITTSIISVYINTETEVKLNNRQKRYADILSTEEDAKTEKEIQDIESKIFEIINNSNIENKQEAIYNLYNNKFKHSYYVNCTSCSKRDIIYNQRENIETNCYEYFSYYINNYCKKIKNTNFAVDTIIDGNIHYIGEYTHQENSIYIELFSKPMDEGLGYPELISNKEKNKDYIGYSYAKFKNNSIIYSSGRYNFVNNALIYKLGFNTTNNSQIYSKDYANSRIVVVREKDSTFTKLILIPYLVIIFSIIHLSISTLSLRRRHPFVPFSSRIKKWYIIMLLAFFFITGISYTYFNNIKYENRVKTRLSGLLNTLTRKLEGHYIEDYSTTETLISLSDILETDINIYNTNGILVNSSRLEIFDNNICSNLIEPNALNLLKSKSNPYIINNETVHSIPYLSAYIPLLDNNNTTIGYINIPYFKENIYKNEDLLNMVVFGANIFILISMLAIFMSVILADKITKPINLIYSRLKSNNLREKIYYKGNDEISRLVDEYNKLLYNLELSAKELAKTEREGAWRNMAKQIAHEIKNPLTPMKLNIQHLERTMDRDSGKWTNQFHKTCSILLDEIDNLSKIASSFSDFANISNKDFKKIELIGIIRNTIELFSNSTTNIKFTTNFDKIFTFASEKQMKSVVVNIINNAIYAIKDVSDGEINVFISKDSYFTTIQIVDNGEGVSNEIKGKLFEPQFTTKTSGMGLGLAICKEIIGNANGEIWFKSEEKKGTSFYIKLPLYRS